MTMADIPFAIKTTDLEGWGYSRADFERLLRLDPRGCLKAVVGGRRVGITTATSYGEVGWIGNVIVIQSHRGQGVGSRLVEEAIAYLEGKDAETIRLNSYTQRVRFYEGMGFKAEFENVRYHGRLNAKGRSSTKLWPLSTKGIARFDESYFGGSRRKLLSILRREFPDTFLAGGGRVLEGFLVGQAAAGSCEVAPFVVAPGRLQTAMDLWRELGLRIPRGEVALTTPSVSKQAARFARWAGLRAGFRTTRMYRGRRSHGGMPEGIIGLGGLEKG